MPDRLTIADASKVSGAEFFRTVFRREPDRLEQLQREVGARFSELLRQEQEKLGLTETVSDPLPHLEPKRAA